MTLPLSRLPGAGSTAPRHRGDLDQTDRFWHGVDLDEHAEGLPGDDLARHVGSDGKILDRGSPRITCSACS